MRGAGAPEPRGPCPSNELRKAARLYANAPRFAHPGAAPRLLDNF